MDWQAFYRRACGLLVVMLCLAPASGFAEKGDYYSSWELHHKGRHKLIWFYQTEQDYLDNRPTRVRVGNKSFEVWAGVRPPDINGLYLLEHADVYDGDEVLDIGTGSGVHAIFAAENAKRIVATDISATAVENARFNARLYKVEEKIDFRVGDLFDPLKDGERFDAIFFNINFPFDEAGDTRKNLHERMFAEIRKYMKPKARIYYQTSFVKNLPDIYDMVTSNGLRIMEIHMEHMHQYRHEPLFMMIQSQ